MRFYDHDAVSDNLIMIPGTARLHAEPLYASRRRLTRAHGD